MSDATESPESSESFNVPDQISDMDELRARVAHIEGMVTELYDVVEKVKPALMKVTGEIQETGIAGLMGMMLRGGR